MGSARSRTELTVAWADGARRTEPDELAVEEPLAIHLDGTLVATTMRTPGHDFELAVGFCHAEGLLAGMPVTGCRYCATGSAVDTDFNVVTVETGGRAPTPTARLGTTSTSCGLCGSTTIEELCERLAPLPGLAVDPAVLAGVPDAVRPAQSLFARTGAVHAAAAFDLDDATVGEVREDVGRHNAVDKVVGSLLLARRLPATGQGLFVSGRASFELVQKAWAAGFGAVVAVSAPTAMAVTTARRANLTLAGFARGGELRLYAEPSA